MVFMKTLILALAAATVTLATIVPATAAPYHHHRECHKVRVHHHWEHRCR
jgi:hypothetical protein